MGLEKVCCLHLFLSPRFVRSLMTHVAVRLWGNFPSLVLEIDECLFVTHERLLNEAFNCQFNAKPKQPTVSSGCWWPSVWFLGCSQSNLAVLSLWLDFRESPWRKQTSPDEHFHSHQKQQTNILVNLWGLVWFPPSYPPLVTLCLNQQEVWSVRTPSKTIAYLKGFILLIHLRKCRFHETHVRKKQKNKKRQ